MVALYHRHVVASQSPAGAHTTLPGGLVRLTNLTLHGNGTSGAAIRSGAPLLVRVRFTAGATHTSARFDVGIHSPDRRTLYATLSTPPTPVGSSGGIVEFAVPSLPLQAGRYHVGPTVVAAPPL